MAELELVTRLFQWGLTSGLGLSAGLIALLLGIAAIKAIKKAVMVRHVEDL